ncbi:MAG: acetyl-CoA carboxylase, biotin carboxyl carrier protein [Candidatus Lambdaproteobacteria bacterium RIFOXYD1_FULL_56_27]|uniref:Biotin carboxyl carrier protein of acetyl-CoA carboxylase n=1 Tax=Candidatus Lambdaproteobacteria bacterium RIFOXYD2_FULL_56_26 TaxID=1817773 RepID=A0A1F6GXM6_9PROT|nr:MAG: acetyl-CoA carboxylase, biotin carboxyl carrier protein [Candidatus Lambdaproteobacteria bacterium RIFOXYC1_FULL_56_13]OGH02804.1 MAG: acetyl-CoA carboxylase, biotin carboxyl carrier protein [Candidatus Lambdaproteobacteria bacterium RIFOXYD2_FULL_56_26]OGH08047.1 MAG: acetyl-CoA carboxylase, biotin carboxyl carrier protein [Candidatus Lambdaproteobacteria bacterium RIFOXYD1_FULL_56_27]
MNIKDLKGIKSLIQLMGESDLSEITLEEDGVKLTLKRERSAQAQQMVMAHPMAQPQLHSVSVNVPAAPAPALSAAVLEDSSLHYITAPLVGTFYTSPAPDAANYVKVGDKVKKGQTLCIIEAMKLMNEIESDIDGTLVEVLIPNASPIDFGAKIFSIRPG